MSHVKVRNRKGVTLHTILVDIPVNGKEDRKQHEQKYMLSFDYWKCWGWNLEPCARHASALQLSQIPTQYYVLICIFISGMDLLYEQVLSSPQGVDSPLMN